MTDYSSKGCVLTKKMSIVPDSEPAEIKLNVEGKSMTCEYSKGELDKNLLSTLYLGIEKCNGPLKNVLSDLAKFYSAL